MTSRGLWGSMLKAIVRNVAGSGSVRDRLARKANMQPRHEVEVVSKKEDLTGRVVIRGIALMCVLLLVVVAFVALRSGDDKHYAKMRNPDLQYLKAVNSVAPPKDP